MNLHIKNMVCNRCIMVVRQVFEQAGHTPLEVNMGEVKLKNTLSSSELKKLDSQLAEYGFEILDDQRAKEIEIIKRALLQKIQNGEIEEHFKLSNYLSKKLNRDYSHISRLFSQVEGITIEQYFILQKIEKVKELIAYEEYTFSEIAWKLGYSSVAHLSGQFKKITGLTPSDFKNSTSKNRKSLDSIK